MSDKLSYLFDLYAADLNSYNPQLENIFLCPLCLQQITKGDDLRNILSEEHIIPSGIGGKLTTLTCKSCNNDDGSQLDANLVQRVRVEGQELPITSRVSIGPGEFGAEIHFSSDADAPHVIRAVPKQSDPKSVQDAQDELVNGCDEIGIKLNYRYNTRKSVVGLIRIAYLMMFRCFGYRYILQEPLELVRHQLRNPFVRTPVLEGVKWRMVDKVPVSNAVMIIRSPKLLRAFFIIVALTDKHYSSVILPGVDRFGERIYENLAQLTEKTPLDLLYVTPVPPSSEHVLDPYHIWQKVFRES